jgi:hypothetical protein
MDKGDFIACPQGFIEALGEECLGARAEILWVLDFCAYPQFFSQPQSPGFSLLKGL